MLVGPTAVMAPVVVIAAVLVRSLAVMVPLDSCPPAAIGAMLARSTALMTSVLVIAALLVMDLVVVIA